MRAQRARQLRVAEIAVDQQGADAQRRDRLGEIGGQRGLALVLERGCHQHDLDRMNAHGALKRKANGAYRLGEKRAGRLERVAHQGRLQDGRQQRGRPRVVAAEFIAAAFGQSAPVRGR